MAERELADRLITAEQDERRRLALFLHDGPVQSLSGIALMIDAAVHAIDSGQLGEAKRVLSSALSLQRRTVGELRDLSFNIEPVVLRDQGFAPAVRALGDQLRETNGVEVEVDVAGGEALAETAQVALYQSIREGLEQAVRRGPPSRISVVVRELEDGGVETVLTDDGSGERRRANVQSIEERLAPLNGRVRVEQPDEGGTVVRVVLPPYTARR